jgi:hypothetical protein
MTLEGNNKSDTDIKKERILDMFEVIILNVNFFVLMFYTYQLRMVHIKLSSQSSDEFFNRIK